MSTPDPSSLDEEARRRLRAKVFGDVLPEGTRDDRDDESASPERGNDAWLKDNVPPHHG